MARTDGSAARSTRKIAASTCRAPCRALARPARSRSTTSARYTARRPISRGRPPRFLLSQYRAADAWPILGLKEGIEKFNEQLIVGEPSLVPRLVPLPVRMPLPPAEHQGSIYENQRASGRRYFVTSNDAPLIAAE